MKSPPHRPIANPVRAQGWARYACIAGMIGALAVPAVEAAETEPPAAEPAQPLIEAARTNTRVLSERLARGVDSWFGDLPFEEGGKVSQGQLSVGVFHRRDQGTDVAVRLTARFRLPNFEKSAYLFVGRDDPRETIKDTAETSSGKQQLLVSRPEDRSFLGGLGGALGDDVSFRVGVSAHLQPFAQVRWDKPWVVAPGHVVNFRETLFWSREDRFGSTSALTYGVELQPLWALYWQGAATITQETRNVEWSSSLGLHRDFGLQKLLSLELLFSGTGTQGTGVGLSDRGVLAKWQQPLYRDWLIGELAAGQFWLRPDANSPRGQAWAFGASVKMRF